MSFNSDYSNLEPHINANDDTGSAFAFIDTRRNKIKKCISIPIHVIDDFLVRFDALDRGLKKYKIGNTIYGEEYENLSDYGVVALKYPITSQPFYKTNVKDSWFPPIYTYFYIPNIYSPIFDDMRKYIPNDIDLMFVFFSLMQYKRITNNDNTKIGIRTIKEEELDYIHNYNLIRYFQKRYAADNLTRKSIIYLLSPNTKKEDSRSYICDSLSYITHPTDDRKCAFHVGVAKHRRMFLYVIGGIEDTKVSRWQIYGDDGHPYVGSGTTLSNSNIPTNFVNLYKNIRNRPLYVTMDATDDHNVNKRYGNVLYELQHEKNNKREQVLSPSLVFPLSDIEARYSVDEETLLLDHVAVGTRKHTSMIFDSTYIDIELMNGRGDHKKNLIDDENICLFDPEEILEKIPLWENIELPEELQRLFDISDQGSRKTDKCEIEYAHKWVCVGSGGVDISQSSKIQNIFLAAIHTFKNHSTPYKNIKKVEFDYNISPIFSCGCKLRQYMYTFENIMSSLLPLKNALENEESQQLNSTITVLSKPEQFKRLSDIVFDDIFQELGFIAAMFPKVETMIFRYGLTTISSMGLGFRSLNNLPEEEHTYGIFEIDDNIYLQSELNTDIYGSHFGNIWRPDIMRDSIGHTPYSILETMFKMVYYIMSANNIKHLYPKIYDICTDILKKFDDITKNHITIIPNTVKNIDVYMTTGNTSSTPMICPTSSHRLREHEEYTHSYNIITEFNEKKSKSHSIKSHPMFVLSDAIPTSVEQLTLRGNVLNTVMYSEQGMHLVENPYDLNNGLDKQVCISEQQGYVQKYRETYIRFYSPTTPEHRCPSPQPYMFFYGVNELYKNIRDVNIFDAHLIPNIQFGNNANVLREMSLVKHFNISHLFPQNLFTKRPITDNGDDNFYFPTLNVNIYKDFNYHTDKHLNFSLLGVGYLRGRYRDDTPHQASSDRPENPNNKFSHIGQSCYDNLLGQYGKYGADNGEAPCYCGDRIVEVNILPHSNKSNGDKIDMTMFDLIDLSRLISFRDTETKEHSIVNLLMYKNNKTQTTQALPYPTSDQREDVVQTKPSRKMEREFTGIKSLGFSNGMSLIKERHKLSGCTLNAMLSNAHYIPKLLGLRLDADTLKTHIDNGMSFLTLVNLFNPITSSSFLNDTFSSDVINKLLSMKRGETYAPITYDTFSEYIEYLDKKKSEMSPDWYKTKYPDLDPIQILVQLSRDIFNDYTIRSAILTIFDLYCRPYNMDECSDTDFDKITIDTQTHKDFVIAISDLYDVLERGGVIYYHVGLKFKELYQPREDGGLKSRGVNDLLKKLTVDSERYTHIDRRDGRMTYGVPEEYMFFLFDESACDNMVLSNDLFEIEHISKSKEIDDIRESLFNVRMANVHLPLQIMCAPYVVSEYTDDVSVSDFQEYREPNKWRDHDMYEYIESVILNNLTDVSPKCGDNEPLGEIKIDREEMLNANLSIAKRLIRSFQRTDDTKNNIFYEDNKTYYKKTFLETHLLREYHISDLTILPRRSVKEIVKTHKGIKIKFLYNETTTIDDPSQYQYRLPFYSQKCADVVDMVDLDAIEVDSVRKYVFMNNLIPNLSKRAEKGGFELAEKYIRSLSTISRISIEMIQNTLKQEMSYIGKSAKSDDTLLTDSLRYKYVPIPCPYDFRSLFTLDMNRNSSKNKQASTDMLFRRLDISEIRSVEEFAKKLLSVNNGIYQDRLISGVVKTINLPNNVHLIKFSDMSRDELSDKIRTILKESFMGVLESKINSYKDNKHIYKLTEIISEILLQMEDRILSYVKQ